MAKVGRPPAFDDHKRQRFCALISLGCDYYRAAAAVGCQPITARREARKNPAFEQQWRESELAALALPLNTIKQAAAENWRVATWYVERTYPTRFAKHTAKYLSMDTIQTMCQELMDEIATAIPDRETQRTVFRRIQRLGKLWQRDWRPGKWLADENRRTPPSDSENSCPSSQLGSADYGGQTASEGDSDSENDSAGDSELDSGTGDRPLAPDDVNSLKST